MWCHGLVACNSRPTTLQDWHRMKQFLRLALQRSVVKRALKYSVIVGAILIAINHSDAILKGEITSGRLFKMVLTVLVPYVVSTLSSVGAMREKHDKDVAG